MSLKEDLIRLAKSIPEVRRHVLPLIRSAGAMPKVKVYDNGGETADRYTVVILDRAWDTKPGYKAMLGLSDDPTHPQGFSQFTEGQDGPHLGKLIKFTDLPRNVQEHVKDRLTDEGKAASGKKATGEEFVIYVDSAEMVTQEDNFEDGAFGNFQHVWSEGHTGPYKSMADVMRHFSHTPGVPNEKDTWFVMEDGRIDASWTVDEDNYAVSARDVAEWKAGKKRLWIADLSVYVTFAKRYTPSEDELVKLTGLSRH